MKLKQSVLLPLICLMFALGLAPAAQADTAESKTTIEDINQETRELLKTLKAYSVEQRDEAISKTETALENLDNRIESLENRMVNQWDRMDQATRDKTHASLQALRQQRTEVAEWYGSLKNSSADAWGHMKKGFSEAYQSLHRAWSNAEKEFKTDR